MPEQRQNDSPKDAKKAPTEQDNEIKPDARAGGQTDSATGDKPDGGRKVQK